MVRGTPAIGEVVSPEMSRERQAWRETLSKTLTWDRIFKVGGGQDT